MTSSLFLYSNRIYKNKQRNKKAVSKIVESIFLKEEEEEKSWLLSVFVVSTPRCYKKERRGYREILQLLVYRALEVIYRNKSRFEWPQQQQQHDDDDEE